MTPTRFSPWLAVALGLLILAAVAALFWLLMLGILTAITVFLPAIQINT